MMSQKRHSWALGTRAGGSGAATRRMRADRLWAKPCQWSLELVSGALTSGTGVVDADRAVVDRELAETAFWAAGGRRRRVRRSDAVDEGDQAVVEALVKSTLGDALDPVGVMDLAGDVGAVVLVHRPGQGVHVGHHLGDVGGSFGAGLDVDDEDIVVPGDDEIGLASEGGGTSLEPEGVLGLDVDGVAAVLEFVPGVGQEGGMVDLPAGEVEV